MVDQLKGKGCHFVWAETQQKSFDKLKITIASEPDLEIVDPNQPFVVETDASDFAVGAQNGRPIAFESKKLDSTQCNYSAYEKELYAIVHAPNKWRHYLYGAKFEIVFYHESIKWLQSQPNFSLI